MAELLMDLEAGPGRLGLVVAELRRIGLGEAITGRGPGGVSHERWRDRRARRHLAGRALQVRGRSMFTTAGTAVVPSGQKTVTVSLAGVTTIDFALATVHARVTIRRPVEVVAGEGERRAFVPYRLPEMSTLMLGMPRRPSGVQ